MFMHPKKMRATNPQIFQKKHKNQCQKIHQKFPRSFTGQAILSFRFPKSQSVWPQHFGVLKYCWRSQPISPTVASGFFGGCWNFITVVNSSIGWFVGPFNNKTTYGYIYIYAYYLLHMQKKSIHWIYSWQISSNSSLAIRVKVTFNVLSRKQTFQSLRIHVWYIRYICLHEWFNFYDKCR